MSSQETNNTTNHVSKERLRNILTQELFFLLRNPADLEKILHTLSIHLQGKTIQTDIIPVPESEHSVDPEKRIIALEKIVEIRKRIRSIAIAITQNRRYLHHKIVLDTAIDEFLVPEKTPVRQMLSGMHKQRVYAALTATAADRGPVFSIFVQQAKRKFTDQYPDGIREERYFDTIGYAVFEGFESYLKTSDPILRSLSEDELITLLTPVVNELCAVIHDLIGPIVVAQRNSLRDDRKTKTSEIFQNTYLHQVYMPSYDLGKYLSSTLQAFLIEKLPEFALHTMQLDIAAAPREDTSLEIPGSAVDTNIITFTPTEEESGLTPEQEEVVVRFFNKLASILSSLVDNPKELQEVFNRILGPLSMGFQLNAIVASPIDFASYMYSREALDVYMFDLLYRAKKAVLLGQLHARLHAGASLPTTGMAGLFQLMKQIRIEELVKPITQEDTILTQKEVQQARAASLQKIEHINMFLYSLHEDIATAHLFEVIIQPAKALGIFTLDDINPLQEAYQLQSV